MIDRQSKEVEGLEEDSLTSSSFSQFFVVVTSWLLARKLETPRSNIAVCLFPIAGAKRGCRPTRRKIDSDSSCVPNSGPGKRERLSLE